MIAPEQIGVQVKDQVVRRVLDGGDLFKYDIPLRLQIRLPDQGAEGQVGQYIDGRGEMGVQAARLIAGVLARRVGVQMPAQDLQREGDLVLGA